MTNATFVALLSMAVPHGLTVILLEGFPEILEEQE